MLPSSTEGQWDGRYKGNGKGRKGRREREREREGKVMLNEVRCVDI